MASTRYGHGMMRFYIPSEIVVAGAKLVVSTHLLTSTWIPAATSANARTTGIRALLKIQEYCEIEYRKKWSRTPVGAGGPPNVPVCGLLRIST